MFKRLITAAALIPLMTACSDSDATGLDNQAEGQLALRFSTAVLASASGSLAPNANTGAANALVVTGANGSLHFEDIRFVLAEVELERLATSVADSSVKFASGPFLVKLPLNGGTITLATNTVPAGTYTELEFEVEDLEDNDDLTAAERQLNQQLLAEMRQSYPAFPSKASMVVRGVFTPAAGEPQPFTVYFDADIKIKMDLIPSVTIPGAQALTVSIDPTAWFKTGAEVMDLAALDGRLIPFELEIRRGFRSASRDD